MITNLTRLQKYHKSDGFARNFEGISQIKAPVILKITGAVDMNLFAKGLVITVVAAARRPWGWDGRWADCVDIGSL